MKYIGSLTVFFIGLLFSGNSFSFENFLNPLSPYPSGCVTISPVQDFYSGGSEVVASGTIGLTSSRAVKDSVLADVTITRTGCAEANRSFLTMLIEIQDDSDGTVELAVIPKVFARIGGVDYPFRLVRDPSSWVERNSFSNLGESQSRDFILDVPQPVIAGYDPERLITPELYNGAFTLVIRDIFDTEYPVDIFAYADDLRPTLMPFNGRLSGIWVAEGASDQGFVISFSELPGTPEQGLIFFSWYTFDSNGNNLWLVGNANYDQGNGAITFDLQLVTNGNFMGDKTATRIPAGTVRITARNCNLLELDYDLREIGLGQSTRAVSRIFGIETAGYTCLDYQSK